MEEFLSFVGWCEKNCGHLDRHDLKKLVKYSWLERCNIDPDHEQDAPSMDPKWEKRLLNQRHFSGGKWKTRQGGILNWWGHPEYGIKARRECCKDGNRCGIKRSTKSRGLNKPINCAYCEAH